MTRVKKKILKKKTILEKRIH